MDSDAAPRRATVEDAPLLARHRRLMFQGMGVLAPAEAQPLERAVEAYLRRAIPAGAYHGWLVEQDDRPIASGGLQLRELIARPGFVGGEAEALIVSMWTDPPHRRRGHGRRLLEAMLAWCRDHGARRIVLHASDDGRPLYALAGFKPTNEMRLDLPSPG